MSEISDGGPAFPGVNGPPSEFHPGMALRDWFAAEIKLPSSDPTENLAQALMGRKCPDYRDHVLACAAWWAEAEAKLRYLKADAMIAAREAKTSEFGDASTFLVAELDVRVGDLLLLQRAIEAGDPKGELLIRVGDMLRETRAAIAKADGRS